MEKPIYWWRTSDVLLHSAGIESAAFPVLYPRTCFGDTFMAGKRYLADDAEFSVFTSHLRKLLSPCTGYLLQPKLTFLLYDITMARRMVMAINVCIRINGNWLLTFVRVLWSRLCVCSWSSCFDFDARWVLVVGVFFDDWPTDQCEYALPWTV